MNFSTCHPWMLYLEIFQTYKLKEEIVVIVDNGPSEQPWNPMVQMLLGRLI